MLWLWGSGAFPVISLGFSHQSHTPTRLTSVPSIFHHFLLRNLTLKHFMSWRDVLRFLGSQEGSHWGPHVAFCQLFPPSYPSNNKLLISSHTKWFTSHSGPLKISSSSPRSILFNICVLTKKSSRGKSSFELKVTSKGGKARCKKVLLSPATKNNLVKLFWALVSSSVEWV